MHKKEMSCSASKMAKGMKEHKKKKKLHSMKHSRKEMMEAHEHMEKHKR